MINGVSAEGFAKMVALALLFIAIVTSLSALGWDSARGIPKRSTHSYLTEWAIEQVKERFPQIEAFRNPLVEGANQELHELRVKGRIYGVDLDAKRVEHKGTNEGCDDIRGWWLDSRDAYRAGEKARAYFLLGIMLHMIQDMGVPAHANKVYHRASLTQLDPFEIMAFWNWRPSFDAINKTDPTYAEPWKYYHFSRDWTREDAPHYVSRTQFSRTWTFAQPEERALLSNRLGRTCQVTRWALQSAVEAFELL
jgi:hypothetical protein